MKKETVFVAMSNQKGGVGKSVFTIVLASYFHYTKNLNVVVVDCDDPQHSLYHMKERDMEAVMKSAYFKQLMVDQYERIHKKAYPILRSSAETAKKDALDFLDGTGEHYDLVIVDLPGTVKSTGVLQTIVNMDYVITPIVADRMVMQSTDILDMITREVCDETKLEQFMNDGDMSGKVEKPEDIRLRDFDITRYI